MKSADGPSSWSFTISITPRSMPVHHIIAVADGGIHAAGRPAELLKPDLIRSVFGIYAMVIPHPVDGTPLCLPLSACGSRQSPVPMMPPG
uniref:hypothetical protein n=1 Tax=uncultured Rhizobium sp. TaxID=155567 RepID=UPI00262C34AA|nr:hypothetical protein [uncultured Rhizobium sp.]